ncbi:phage terminase small subunit P27 family [Neoroseomonas rubea]|uniref:phage terminase small subunit P27 family n=1 Tax=Neoroseomonas rubea TaxID=2748666 RepID=UPI0018E00F3F|nr:phage terminase small subunit P27 family [Roseomonas rubea]
MTKRPGRPPKPTALHRLQGSYEPSRHRQREAAEPPPIGELSPVPPEHLTEEARRIWIAATPFMMKGVVGAGDAHVVTAFCEAAAMHRRAVRAQALLDANKELPFLAKGKDGQPTLSPYLRLIRQQADAMVRYASELGLSPSARARIGALAFAPDAAPLSPSEDPWGSFQVIKGGKR